MRIEIAVDAGGRRADESFDSCTNLSFAPHEASLCDEPAWRDGKEPISDANGWENSQDLQCDFSGRQKLRGGAATVWRSSRTGIDYEDEEEFVPGKGFDLGKCQL